MILMNHNAEAYVRVFHQVNRIFDNPEEYETDIPVTLKGLRYAIEDIWTDPHRRRRNGNRSSIRWQRRDWGRRQAISVWPMSSR